jgi:cell division septum initiation protein DivIVA
MLLTAQRVIGDLKEAAQAEAKLIVREAQGRADVLIQKAQVRLDELDHECSELKLRRRDAEGTVEATIQALYRALEFMRDQDQIRSDEKVLLHRPRQADQSAPQNKGLQLPDVRVDERKASS